MSEKKQPKYFYAEMLCPPEMAKGLVWGLEQIRSCIDQGFIAGEWRDRSTRLNDPACTFRDMLVIDPTNIAFIVHDYRVIKEHDNARVFLELIPLNRYIFNDSFNKDEWLFIPRCIGDKKNPSHIHVITIDIKRRVDDAKMMKEAYQQRRAQEMKAMADVMDAIKNMGTKKEGESDEPKSSQ